MNSVSKAALGTLAAALCFAAPAGADNLFSGKIGFAWPQDAQISGSSGNAEVAYGKIIDKKVAFGAAVDFLWNVNSKEARITNNIYQTISQQQAYMFPVMFFFQVDPVPDLIVHPVAHFDIGYNSLIYSYTRSDTSSGTTQSSSVSPYYNGLIIKFGVDGLYDMGSNSSIFLGLEYQWAGTSTSSTNGVFGKLDMSGLLLSAGFRVVL